MSPKIHSTVAGYLTAIAIIVSFHDTMLILKVNALAVLASITYFNDR